MPFEPDDVGPRAGGDQPAMAYDRQLVTNLLVAANAYGRLRDWDFSHRMMMVQAARTFDDLIPLTRDLMRG
jgi:hypothetical protein